MEDARIFEVIAPGFDGGTDSTDHLVTWVMAPDPYTVRTVMQQTLTDAEISVFKVAELDRSVKPIGIDDIDYVLPRHSESFAAYVAKASGQSELEVHRSRHLTMASVSTGIINNLLRDVRSELEKTINRVPTSKARDELTSANILITQAQNHLHIAMTGISQLRGKS